MWISYRIIIVLLCSIFPTQSETSPEVGHCLKSADCGSQWSSGQETSTSCGGHRSDVASTIISDLYRAIEEVEEDLGNPEDYPADYRPHDGEEFDFIVVGAGSAGAVVANRLSEVGSWRVLLLEAGGNPTKTVDLPGLAPTLQNTELDWQYRTDPEENACLGMINSSCYWPRGKVLGGSSAINYMVYVRGNARDYDNWAAAGNTGWGYEDVLPYFRKSQDLRVNAVLETSDWERYHGRYGFLKIEPWTFSLTDPLIEIFGKGFEELGYPFNLDYNGKRQSGFTRFYATLQDHKRCSSAKAFLSPLKDRENLKTAKHSLVTKLLFDLESSSMLGVEFIDKQGKPVRVTSKKEVVLSAGAIGSPQVLMLSGIGHKEDLESLGIPVVSDLPVGENLQDHFLMSSLVVTVNYSVPYLNKIEGAFEFVTKGTGYLTNLGVNFGAFVNIEPSEFEDFPDMEFMPIYFRRNDEESLRGFMGIFGYKEEVLKEYVEINKIGDSVILLGSMLRPFSRGKISLKNTDPRTHPKIVSGGLSDARDVELYLKTYDFMERLVETKAFKGMDAKLHEVPLEGCKKHPLRSKEYRVCSLRHLTGTTYHYSGTCAMGPALDPKVVVDPHLRVQGVRGLRVADASIMPTIVGGNINAAVIMIGEKAADLIKQDWV